MNRPLLYNKAPIKIGDRRHRLVVIGKFTARSKTGASVQMLSCICDCGKTSQAREYHVRIEVTRSCGCIKVETTRTNAMRHGHIKNQHPSREYNTWHAMRSRCYRKTDPCYKNYGGRGIAVCDRWKDSFENFLSDMGPRPMGKTLDRIENDKGYSPENCRWATAAEQRANTRLSKPIEAFGMSRSMHDWCKQFSICPTTVSYRMKSGLSVEESLLRIARVWSLKPRQPIPA